MSQFSDNAPAGLASFQREYGQHLRNPQPHNKVLQAIPKRRSQVYEELFFNNICGFINNCFPVAKSLFSDDRWLQYCREFFTQWRCETPYFSEIPSEFVAYMAQAHIAEHNPAWLPELLHYEWIELEVDISIATPLNTSSKTSSNPPGNPLSNPLSNPLRDTAQSALTDQARVFTTPTLRNLAFSWPVHRISEDHIPAEPEATFLAVYRNSEDSVEFMEINAMTAALLEIIAAEPMTAEQALTQLAIAINHPAPEQLVQFGESIVNDFIDREILIRQ